jgi:hypothetical protein
MTYITDFNNLVKDNLFTIVQGRDSFTVDVKTGKCGIFPNNKELISYITDNTKYVKGYWMQVINNETNII